MRGRMCFYSSIPAFVRIVRLADTVLRVPFPRYSNVWFGFWITGGLHAGVEIRVFRGMVECLVWCLSLGRLLEIFGRAVWIVCEQWSKLNESQVSIISTGSETLVSRRVFDLPLPVDGPTRRCSSLEPSIASGSISLEYFLQEYLMAGVQGTFACARRVAS